MPTKTASQKIKWFKGFDVDVSLVLQSVIETAIESRASDIHLQWYTHGLEVRFRIDGVLDIPGETITDQNGKRLVSHIINKIEGMRIDEHMVPQDGRFLMKVKDKSYDFRVNCLPTALGKNITMRILDKGNVPESISILGFDKETEERFLKMIRQPNGMFIFTGPTGSGKSTTQYAVLNLLNEPGRKILTVEQPVEYLVNGLSQVQVQNKMTFALGLRAFLRQDPDIIMIGEMRDLETASIAIESALTGHMVLSTLHTNNAYSAPTRLVDMGIEPHLIPDTVTGVLAQRLARKICEHCKEPYEATDNELAIIGYVRKSPDEKVILHRGTGCAKCRSGFRGRLGIFELLCMNDEIASLVSKQSPLDEIKAAAIRNGMKTLRNDARDKVLLGQTTPAEIERVIFTAGG